MLHCPVNTVVARALHRLDVCSLYTYCKVMSRRNSFKLPLIPAIQMSAFKWPNSHILLNDSAAGHSVSDWQCHGIAVPDFWHRKFSKWRFTAQQHPVKKERERELTQHYPWLPLTFFASCEKPSKQQFVALQHWSVFLSVFGLGYSFLSVS